MYYSSKEELGIAIREEYDDVCDKIILLESATSTIVIGIFYESTIVNSLIAIKGDNGWEVIEDEKSRLVSSAYIAYFVGMIELLSEKEEIDELLGSELFTQDNLHFNK